VTKTSASIDTTRCPLCHEANRCASAAGDAARCWCMSAEIPKQALQLVPDELKGRSCICQACATRHGSKAYSSAEVSTALFVDAAAKTEAATEKGHLETPQLKSTP